MNVDISALKPGTFGVSHGGGVPGIIIRTATQSEAGHAFLYLGQDVLVQGQPKVAAVAPADSHSDAIWAHRMWDQLQAELGWSNTQVAIAQANVVKRGRELIGTPYDFGAYLGFELEVLHLRNEQQLSPDYQHDNYRVCSALVADALRAGGVPLDFVPSDGPGLVKAPSTHIVLPDNLVAPGMLLGLAERKDWT